MADGQIGSNLVVAVPVSSAEEIVGMARASVPASLVWRDVILAWLVMATLAGGSLLVAILGSLSTSVSALKTEVAVLQSQKCICGQAHTASTK